MYCYGLCVFIVTLTIITVQSYLTNSKTGTSKIVCRLICLEIISLNYSQWVMSLRQRKGFSHLPRVTSVIIMCTNLVYKWLSNTVRETREFPRGVQPINFCNDWKKYEGRTKADYSKLTDYFNITVPKAHLFPFVSSLRWSRNIISQHIECCSFLNIN